MDTAVTQVSKEMDSPAFWREQEMLLLENVMRLVGKGPYPDIVLREILHLMSELLGLNRGPASCSRIPMTRPAAFGMRTD